GLPRCSTTPGWRRANGNRYWRESGWAGEPSPAHFVLPRQAGASGNFWGGAAYNCWVLTLQQAGWLFAVAVVSGSMNAVAGGGSFLSFPALLLVGVPPIQANATNTIALSPGLLGSI